jgi:hypothetical protein
LPPPTRAVILPGVDERDDHADNRFPPQTTLGEIALAVFGLALVAMAIGLIAALLFHRP